MSSILDALNKLEQEKSSRQAESAGVILPATPEEAAAELIGDASFGNSHPGAIRSWAPLLAALLLGVVITSVTVITTVWLVASPGTTVAATSPAPAPEAEAPLVHKYTIPVQVETAAPEQEDPKTVAEETVKPAVVAAVQAPPEPKVVKPVPKPAPEPEPTPEPIPEPAPQDFPVAKPVTPPLPEPAPEPVPEVSIAAQAPPEIVPEPVAPAPVVEATPPPAEEHPLPDEATLLRQQELARRESMAPENDNMIMAKATPVEEPGSSLPPVVVPPAARPDSGPVDMNSLPRLSVQDRESLGLDNLRLNVLRPADKDQPDALAIINLKKVYVGEMIPGTRARLIAVESNAIGVEVNSAGALKRFRIPR